MPDPDIRVSLEGEAGATAAAAQVATYLVADGEPSLMERLPLPAFLLSVAQPFEIAAQDSVFLNAAIVYDEGVLHAIERHVADESGAPARFVPLRPDGIEQMALPLASGLRAQFAKGRPVWRRSALSASASRGRQCHATTKALRDGLFAWAVIAEQVVRHALLRAGRERHRALVRRNRLTWISQDLVGCGLGHDPAGEPFPIDLADLGMLKLGKFDYASVHREARRTCFAPARAGSRSARDPFLYAAPPIVGAKELKRDIVNFERLHPDLAFDALAIAEWAVRILIFLRVALAASKSLDRRRGSARSKLHAAASPDEARDIAGAFANGAVLTFKKGAAAIELEQVLGPAEAALIALLTGITPDRLDWRICRFDWVHRTALIQSALWLGGLFRQREAVLSRPVARQLASLLDPDLPADRRSDFLIARELILSFLTAQGRERLQEGVAAVLEDGCTRSVVAVSPHPAPVRRTPAPHGAGRGSLLESLSSDVDAASVLPAPLCIEARRLLLPGDYAEAWCGRCDTLLDALRI
jgi:hypothetical protein